jgi:type III secretion protein D
MDRAPTTLDTLAALELRVLDGAQQGARAPLSLGTPCVLAADAGRPGVVADIVLREERSPPAAVRITPELAHALIEVLHGEIVLGGQVLAAGAQSPWPRHMPLAIGSARVAFGLACEDTWPIADGADETTGATAPEAVPAPRKLPLHQRPEAWLGGVGAVVLLLCAVAFGMLHLGAQEKPAPVADAGSIAQQLKTSPFAALEATAHPDGRLELSGRLGTLAQRAELDRWLAQRQARASIDVQIDEALAREVTEVLRVNGVTAQVHATAPGQLVAEASERDAARLARAEEAVRRDVHGFASLALRNTAQPLPPPAPPVVDDPGKRIASIVPGETAYVVTADGSRYFVGAMLPSGHRITGVAPQSLTLERDGRESTLNF